MTENDETYVFLEFNEKITPTIFENDVFLRVANLHKSHPLVQINDLVFKGTYDECVGTNIFFEEVEDPPLKTNIFEKDTAIRLKHFLTQTKVIRLKQMKLPKKVIAGKKDYGVVDINLKQDYQQILSKLEQNTLNIEDLAKKDNPTTTSGEYYQGERLDFNFTDDVKSEPEKEIESYVELLQNKSPNSLLEAKYERLKRLARRPVRRMKSPELVEECEPRLRETYEYHNLECRVLQNSNAFRYRNSPILEKNLIGGVDLDRCVLQGLIAPSNDIFRTLSTSELNKVLSLDNLENLSLPARYLVLKECVTKIEELIENTTPEELKEIDENGRNVQDICNIFRKLVSKLERVIAGNGEIKVIPQFNKTDELQEDNYIKYKYDPSQDIIVDCPEIFDENFQIEAGNTTNNTGKPSSRLNEKGDEEGVVEEDEADDDDDEDYVVS